MVGNLRLIHERRLVAQIFLRWNRVEGWLCEAHAFEPGVGLSSGGA